MATPCGVRAAVETAWALARRTVRSSSRWVWSSFRAEWGGDSTPAGGTGGVLPGGRGDRRRSGWQRRPRRSPVTPQTQPRSRASTGGDRLAEGEHPAIGPTGGTLRPNRERRRSGVYRGIEGGRSTPRQPRRVNTGGRLACRPWDAPSETRLRAPSPRANCVFSRPRLGRTGHKPSRPLWPLPAARASPAMTASGRLASPAARSRSLQCFESRAQTEVGQVEAVVVVGHGVLRVVGVGSVNSSRLPR